MDFRKSNYFSICDSFMKLSLLLILCFLTACAKQSNTKQFLQPENQIQIAENSININTATIAELEKLPHIGAQTAREIVEHREKFGQFRKPEHLMFVRGVSDARFREMRNLVKVE